MLAVVGESSRADISRRIGGASCSHCALLGGVAFFWTGDLLVFPAASRPSISRRISLLPKILASERESAAPMVGDVCLYVAVDLRLLFGRIQGRARQCFSSCVIRRRLSIQCRYASSYALSRRLCDWACVCEVLFEVTTGRQSRVWLSRVWLWVTCGLVDWGCFRGRLRREVYS